MTGPAPMHTIMKSRAVTLRPRFRAFQFSSRAFYGSVKSPNAGSYVRYTSAGQRRLNLNKSFLNHLPVSVEPGKLGEPPQPPVPQFDEIRKVKAGSHKLMNQQLEYVNSNTRVRRWRKTDMANTTVAQRLITAGLPNSLVKDTLNLEELTAPPVHLDRFTVFLQGGVSKAVVLESLTDDVELRHLRRLPIKDIVNLAFVVLVSPEYASWLEDTSFMSRFIATFNASYDPGRDSGAQPSSINVLAAVVDGLCPAPPFRELRQGFSVQCGELDNLLPGLWKNQYHQAQDLQHERSLKSSREDAESFLSLTLNNPAKSVVTLPLANTLFQNGRRSTLLASKWWPCSPLVSTIPFRPSKTVEMRAQKVVPPSTNAIFRGDAELAVRLPLVPITVPRRIAESFGNIIRAVDLEDTQMPASTELEKNIPLLLKAREDDASRLRPLSQDSVHRAGPIGVWALVIPEKKFNDRLASKFISPNLHRALNLESQMTFHHTKLAFEAVMDYGNMGWEMNDIFPHALKSGCHFHKILSGGGGWGPKAGLLSLDPQTSFGESAEEDDMDKFIKSFSGEKADGSQGVARPGDYVQFFVEAEPPSLSSQEVLGRDPEDSSTVGDMQFGVGDASIKDKRHQKTGPVEILHHHFGAYSARGLFLRTEGEGGAPNTKLDIPSSYICATTKAHHSKWPVVPWRKKVRKWDIVALQMRKSQEVAEKEAGKKIGKDAGKDAETNEKK